MTKVEEIKQLKELLDSGALSQEEFETEKQRILSSDDDSRSKTSVQDSRNLPISWEENLRSFIKGCALDNAAQVWLKRLLRKALPCVCVLLLIMAFFVPFKTYMSLLLTIIALLYGIASYKTEGILPKIILYPVLLLATYFCVIGYLDIKYYNEYFMHEKSIARLNYGFFYYIPYLAVLNLLIPANIVLKKRILSTCLLSTVLNPILWSLEFTGAIKHFGGGYSFVISYRIIAGIAAIFSLITIYCLITGTPFHFKQRWEQEVTHAKKCMGWIKVKSIQYKKLLVKLSIAIAVLLLGLAGCSIYHHHVEKEQAKIAAREKEISDSIAAVEKARKDSIAAIIQARKDSIAAVEQARQDSINRIEHAAFVKKYSNIGLIITHLEMTRGKDRDGDCTKGIEFRIFNPTNKTIKYVIAKMVAVNGVGDVMSYEKSCRGIGPVASHDYASWEFEDVFYDKNDVIDDLSVSFTVIYTNGSSKNIKWTTAYNNDFSSYWFEE